MYSWGGTLTPPASAYNRRGGGRGTSSSSPAVLRRPSPGRFSGQVGSGELFHGYWFLRRPVFPLVFGGTWPVSSDPPPEDAGG